jgi:hypothetical protein
MVERAHKIQGLTEAACKRSTYKSIEQCREAEDMSEVAAFVDAISENLSQKAVEAIVTVTEWWSDTDRPLLRAMEMAGYSEANSGKPEAKVSVLMSDLAFNNIKAVVEKGVYNTIRLAVDEAAGTPEGELGRKLLEARAGVLAALEGCEVQAEDVDSGLFTFTLPSPKGNYLN